MMATQHPYADDPSWKIRFWAHKYQTKFSEEPTVFSVCGYQLIDAFVKAAGKAGANLTTESFIKAMDTMVISPDMFGTGEMTFSPTERLDSNASRMSQSQDGKWKVVADCMSTK